MPKVPDSDIESLKLKYENLAPHLTERTLRLWCASEAKSYGYMGVTALHKATGVSRPRIYSGLNELEQKTDRLNPSRIRKPGGGRKAITQTIPNILTALKELICSTSRGDPMSNLLWTCKSSPKLQLELEQQYNYKISQPKVCHLLKDMGYSLQSNNKRLEGSDHPDRNEQFEYINKQCDDFLSKNCPVISVDTKKKENIGNYKNNGKEYSEKGKPLDVNGHDFPNKELGKVAPYGVYDIGKNKGWVNVGISSDTAQFAVNSIRVWWHNMGKQYYPDTKEIMITADCGGSNGNRVKLWKVELQKLANELGVSIHVCHFPPGTSKWNKIEHRMFSYISKNWRGRPLISREVVVNLISNTTTRKGLKIKAVLDSNDYEKGIKVTDKQINNINLVRHDFHGEWNYSINR